MMGAGAADLRGEKNLVRRGTQCLSVINRFLGYLRYYLIGFRPGIGKWLVKNLLPRWGTQCLSLQKGRARQIAGTKKNCS